MVQDIRSLRHMPIELLHASPNNPRKHFADADLDDLANSIREKGLLQPIVVRPRADGEYEIVAGERRWRAAQRAGIHEVPVLIRELTDGEALEIALIENIQRSDLNPLEEARAYGLLLEQFSYTQQQLADSVGKSRSHIANTLAPADPAGRGAKPDRGWQAHRRSCPHTGRNRFAGGTGRPDHQAGPVGARSREPCARRRPSSRKRKAQAGEGRRHQGPRKLRIASDRTQGRDHPQGRSAAEPYTITYKTLEQLEEICRKLQASR